MRRGSLFWGLILILAGALFLLSNLGILNVDVWRLIWPLFLIALGISILWGMLFRRPAASEQASIPLNGAARARLHIVHGAGRFNLHSGAAPGALVDGSFGGGVDVDSRISGDLLDASLRLQTQNFPFFMWPGEPLDWNVALSREIPLSLDLEAGANESNIDLGDLQVKELRLKSGASSTSIQMPTAAGSTHAQVETGAASVNIHIPQGVAARIRARGGLASITVNTARFPRSGDLYQSPDYDAAPNRIDLDVQTGVGSVDIS